MGIEKKTPNSLTDYTPQTKDLNVFFKAYQNCGGTVNETTLTLMEQSIKDNGITVNELHTGLKSAFEKEQFMNWANILKHIKSTPNPEKARQFYNAKPA